MPVIDISSMDDPRLAPYRKMKEKELARDGLRFIAEGEQVVRRLLGSGLVVESVLVARRKQLVIAALTPEPIPVLSAGDEIIERVIGFEFHSGVLACGLRPASVSLREIIPPIGQPALLAVCQQITNTENLGSLIRVFAAFGADAVVLGERCCDPFFRQSVRVSMGAVFSIPIVWSKNLLDDLEQIGQLGIHRMATVLANDARPLNRFAPPTRVAAVFGSEAQGLDADTIARCDSQVTIPMRRGTDSLNVAIAAGVVFYHLTSAALDDGFKETTISS